LRAIPPPRWFERELGGLSASQVGAGLQAAVGEAVAGLARDWLQRAGMRSLCLAGGLFANVRLNQAVGEAGGCEDLYVFPHMGDGGLCIGAAWAQQGAPAPHEPLNPYLGPSLISPRESPPDQVGIARQPLTPTAVEALAAALQEGEAVAISRGRLEFGPRALGNRSLLFSARRPELAEKWNRALARPSVMPFAPAVRAEDFARVAEGAPWRCFAHMTCTANAKPGIRARYPLAVHADGSMRVQTVTRSAQPLLYDFLTAYAKHEDPPLVINTSFNLHGEPIVADSRRAWRLFLQLPLAALVTDDACVWKSA
jgi:carbamoyltransferase